MTAFQKILFWNLIVFIVYTGLFCATVNLNDGYAFLGLMMLIIAQSTICLVVSIALFIAKKKRLGQAFLLSSGLALLIGFSSCLGIGSLV